MAHVVCLLKVESDRATFEWSDGTGSFEPYVQDSQVFRDFQEIAKDARDRLSDLVKCYVHDPDDLPNCSYALAEAGHELYQQIFDPGAGQAGIATEIRNWLESLRRAKTVETLEIVVEKSPWAMPWNVVYDRKPNKEAFLSNDDSHTQWRPFWGIRYNLSGGWKVNPLRRMPLLVRPDVLIVVDPSVRDGLPEDQQQRLASFVKTHNLALATSKDQLTAEINTERPELVYWLSHATPSALVLSEDEITPSQLRRLLRRRDSGDPYELGGLGFLNACQTAEAAETGSFLEALHSVGFSGMIGTEHQTVDTFANTLGLDFLEAFLYGGEPVGEIMRRLRARVPLGLLYGTYCPPNIRVTHEEPGDMEESSDSVKIIVTVPIAGTPEAGVTLGPPTIAPSKAAPLPDQPYRSLDYYTYQDRALFAGRDVDVERFATLLDDANTRILILHGESGIGKSSFLRAGVIPYLEDECLGYRFMREQHEDEGRKADEESVLFIRATNDPFGQLAQALCSYCARPYSYQTPTGKSVEVDLPGVLTQLSGKSPDSASLREAMRNDPALLGRLLGAIGDRLPNAAVLVIDQCEEVFTLAQSREDVQTRQLAMAMLRRAITAPGDFKIILSLRTEYYGRLIDRLRRGLHDTGGVREYLLTDFDEDALVQAITLPTSHRTIRYSSEVPFDKYNFRFDKGVPEEIARRVVAYTSHRRDSVLPLVQIICTQLYDRVRRRDDRSINADDLEQLRGIEGGMESHVEGLLERLLGDSPGDEKRLKSLFTQLYLRQPDGSLTTALLPEDDVARRWRGRMPFSKLLDGAVKMRLLRVNSLRIGGKEERRYVSLGHDALAKLAAQWDEELSRGARMRRMVAIFAGALSVVVLVSVLTLITFAAKAATTVADNRAEHQRGMAAQRLETARFAADKWLVGFNEELEYYPGVQKFAQGTLEDAIDYYKEELSERERNDPSLQVELGRIWLRLGEVQRNLSDFEPAQASAHKKAAEDSYREAVEILQALSDSPEARRELANTYARIRSLCGDQGRYPEAEQNLRQAVDSHRELIRGETGGIRQRFDLAMALFYLAKVLLKQNDAMLVDEAKGLLDEANTIITSIVEVDIEAEDDAVYRRFYRRALARTRRLLGDAALRDQDEALALTMFHAAMKIMEELSEEESSQRPSYFEDVASIHSDIARAWRQVNRDANEVASNYLGAFREYSRLADKLDENPRYKLHAAKSLRYLAGHWHRLGLNQEAQRELSEAETVLFTLLSADPTNNDYRMEAAAYLLLFGRVKKDLDDNDGAKADFRDVVTILVDLINEHSTFGDDCRYRLAICRSHLGQVHAKTGEAAEAERLYDVATQDLLQLVGCEDLEALLQEPSVRPLFVDALARMYTHKANLLWNTNRRNQARGLYRDVVSLREKLSPDAEYLHLFAWFLANCCDEEIRDPARAIELAQQAIDANRKALEAISRQDEEPLPESATYWNTLGVAQYRAGNWEECIRSLETAKNLRSEFQENALDSIFLAMAHSMNGSPEAANTHYREAVAIMDATRPGHIELRRLCADAERLLGIKESTEPGD